MKQKTANRIIKALQNGWGFANLTFNPSETGRHSLWISPPKMSLGCYHKVDASIPANEYIDALLDEAGVPK